MRFASNPSIANPTPPGQSKTVNKAGGAAYTQTPRVELASLLLTSMLQDRYHSGASEDLTRARALVTWLAKEGDLLFAAKAALYARREHGLRSISHVVAGEIARHCKGMPWTRSFLDKVIYRPDDACEILAYYMSTYSRRKLPYALKEGVGRGLRKFDEYRIAKYAGGSRDLKLLDVVNLCHPKPTEAITALVKGTLKPADTWERAISAAGQAKSEDGEPVDATAAKATEWARLLAEKKLGYLACLRNLRNIVEQAPQCLPEACKLLTDPDKVRKALIFPFQIAAAGDALRDCQSAYVRPAIEALVTACDLAVANVPEFPGKTLVVVDMSGSMCGGPKPPIRTAGIFAAALYKANTKADLMGFSDSAAYMQLPASGVSVLPLALSIEQAAKAGGTNFHAIFQAANRPYDRVIILSDMQGWMGSGTPDKDFEAYKKRTGCDPFLYSFDLTGHGTTQFPANRIAAIAGFSDKVFDLMKAVEADRGAMVATIEAVDV